MTQQPPQAPQPPHLPDGTPAQGTQAQGTQAQAAPSGATPSEVTSEHTAPLWYEQTRAQPQHPSYPPMPPPTPTGPYPAAMGRPGAESARSAKSRPLAQLVLVAVLAAGLASASTYAVTRPDDSTSPAAQARPSATSAAPVVQADASAPNWSVTAAAVSPSVVAISVESGQRGGQGSGVIFDSKGHILTNHHVVAVGGQSSQISVTLNDGRTYDATIVGTDPSTDLAVLQLTNAPKDLKAIALGESDLLKVGEPVMAVGNPLGLAGTVTTGIVSALNRPVTTSRQDSGDPSGPQSAGEPVVTNAVQTSAAINPGNSGGALVSAGGQLIGINSAIASLGSGGASAQSGNIGIGFAIPVNEAASIANQLITSGKAAHAYLGVSSKDDVVADGSAKRAAAVLTSVASGTPADQSGLLVGDAIVSVDGDSIDGSLSLVAQVRERTVGDKVTLKIVRDGQAREVSVTLTSKPTTNQ